MKGPDNKPVDKALVLVQAARGAFPFAPTSTPVSTRTDAAGNFRLELKGRGPHTVRVEAAGLAPATLDKVVPPAKLPVTLVKGGAIEGTVRDGNTGSPLPRITIEAREERPGVSAQWDADAGVGRAQSDEQGRFRIEGLAVGLHAVNARARGFDNARRSGVRTGGRVDLVLFPASAVVGTVRDAQGQPVAKAVVRAQGDVMPFRFGAAATRWPDRRRRPVRDPRPSARTLSRDRARARVRAGHGHGRRRGERELTPRPTSSSIAAVSSRGG